MSVDCVDIFLGIILSTNCEAHINNFVVLSYIAYVVRQYVAVAIRVFSTSSGLLSKNFSTCRQQKDFKSCGVFSVEKRLKEF